jgi:hypothetical protein
MPTCRSLSNLYDAVMNLILPRFVKNAYRKEPISSFVFIVGGVDLAIGGLGGYGGLLFLGLLTAGGAIGLRWWQWQRIQKSMEPERVAQYALPPQSSRPAVPMLSISPKRPPN